eukprot:Hpha_TRINITY_DN16603_c3_g3::TRINITY_DN16603_c3_g3_i1::g.183048::m.183048
MFSRSTSPTNSDGRAATKVGSSAGSGWVTGSAPAPAPAGALPLAGVAAPPPEERRERQSLAAERAPACSHTQRGSTSVARSSSRSKRRRQAGRRRRARGRRSQLLGRRGGRQHGEQQAGDPPQSELMPTGLRTLQGRRRLGQLGRQQLAQLQPARPWPGQTDLPYLRGSWRVPVPARPPQTGSPWGLAEAAQAEGAPLPPSPPPSPPAWAPPWAEAGRQQAPPASSPLPPLAPPPSAPSPPPSPPFRQASIPLGRATLHCLARRLRNRRQWRSPSPSPSNANAHWGKRKSKGSSTHASISSSPPPGRTIHWPPPPRRRPAASPRTPRTVPGGGCPPGASRDRHR